MPHISDSSADDLIRFVSKVVFGRHAVALLAFLAICSAAGAYLMPAPAKTWFASAMIRIGHAGDTRDPLLDPHAVRQRVLFRGFVLEAMKAAGMPTDVETDETARMAMRSFSVVQKGPNNDSPTVEIRVQAKDPETAKKIIASAVSVLIAEHKPAITAYETRVRNEIDSLNEAAATTETQRRQLMNAAKEQGLDKEVSKGVTLADKIQIVDVDARRLAKQREMLEEQLNPTRTYQTAQVGEMVVSDMFFGPSRAWGALTGFCMGVFVYVVFLLMTSGELRHAINRARGYA